MIEGSRHSARSVLFIGHDASRTGAPIVLLHLLRWLKANAGLRFGTLLVRGGPMEEEYRSLGPTWVLDRQPSSERTLLDRVPGIRGHRHRRRRDGHLRGILDGVRALGPDLLYANTVATWPAVSALPMPGPPMILHVHELEMALRKFAGLEAFEALKGRASLFLAVSEAVRGNLVERHGIPPSSVELVHEFVETYREPAGGREDRRRRLCEELGIDPASPVTFVGGSGTTDWRKGPDLFLQVAMRVVRSRAEGPPAHFFWVGGDRRSEEARQLEHDVEKAGLSGRVHLLGSRPDGIGYIDLMDVFALTSREDPYPLVMLEAAALGKPIVCFEGSGGPPEFVGEGCGFVVPYLDVDAMAGRVLELLGSPGLRASLGEAGRSRSRRHDLDHTAPRVLELIERTCRRPS